MVNLNELRSIAKVFGTVVSVGGAMVMTLYKGPIVGKGSGRTVSNSGPSASAEKNMVKGSIFIFIACSCWSCFITLQVISTIYDQKFNK